MGGYGIVTGTRIPYEFYTTKVSSFMRSTYQGNDSRMYGGLRLLFVAGFWRDRRRRYESSCWVEHKKMTRKEKTSVLPVHPCSLPLCTSR